MAAYRRVYGFGHLRADCRGPASALEPYVHFEFANTVNHYIIIIIIIETFVTRLLQLKNEHKRYICYIKIYKNR